MRLLIGGHRPDLRRGEELFPEFDAVDLRGLRHDTHDALETELRVVQRKFHEGTKFAKLCRWRAASLLYIVAEEGLFAPFELPVGWGLLVKRGAELELVTKPCLRDTTREERVALVERIASAVATRERRQAGASLVRWFRPRVCAPDVRLSHQGIAPYSFFANLARTWIPFSSFLPIIQLAITPVILISGMGALMITLTNRMARIVDRTRVVAEAMPAALPEDRKHLESQLDIMWRRALLLRRAVTSNGLSMLVSCFVGGGESLPRPCWVGRCKG